MTYTIILELENKNYHVGECENPETYIKRRDRRRGFWCNNKGKAKIIRIYKGSYKYCINQIGIKNLLEMENNQAELEHFMLEYFI